MVDIHGSEQGDMPKAPDEFSHINRYWDKQMKVYAAKILPGECYVSSYGEMIGTVLGSCVSACIRDKRIGVGGMNHFMLPVQHCGHAITRVDSTNTDLCYGNWAMEFLINAILKSGGDKKNFEVKVFGGGRVLTGLSHLDVGARNAQFVLDYLERDGLQIVSDDLGGDHARKILFFPDTGAVKLKRLRTMSNSTVERRERDYLKTVNTVNNEHGPSGDIELF